MQIGTTERTRVRSAWRLWLGKWYYTAKRYGVWWLRRGTYTTARTTDTLAIRVVQHQSVLVRPLQNALMHLQQNKIINLRIASAAIDGVLIHPGQVFSLWYLVGMPTAAKGYLPGMVLVNGQVREGIAGGLCQLGNLLFWMLLQTPLSITERWRHSFDVFPDQNRTLPFGSGATLSYNYMDLQCVNNTAHTFQIRVWLDEECLRGEVWCNTPLGHTYHVVERNHEIRLQWWGGYSRHNELYRQCIDAQTGAMLHEELVVKNDALMMYNPLLNPPTERACPTE